MMKEAIATGETVEQAYEKACEMLGVESHEAKFEILEMPVKKTFGLFGGSPAKVRAYVESSPAETAAAYLKKVVSEMGLRDVEVSIQEEENGAMLSLSGEDIGFIIGHRGETLDALQYLAGLVANHVGDGYYRITLDIGNYREKRKETLEVLGRKMAAKALKTGRNCSLEPMNPYERRIIHTAVQEVEGAKSWSEGEDLARHVVIGPEEGERPQRRSNYRGGNRRGGPKGGQNNRRSHPSGNRSHPQGDRKPSGNRSHPQGDRKPSGNSPKRDDGDMPLYGRIDRKA